MDCVYGLNSFIRGYYVALFRHILFESENNLHYVGEMTLCDLQKNMAATVIGFSQQDHRLETRLREIGFAEGDRVEILQRGLLGRNPLSVRLNRTRIAMRKYEARAVLVEPLST